MKIASDETIQCYKCFNLFARNDRLSVEHSKDGHLWCTSCGFQNIDYKGVEEVEQKEAIDRLELVQRIIGKKFIISFRDDDNDIHTFISDGLTDTESMNCIDDLKSVRLERIREKTDLRSV